MATRLNTVPIGVLVAASSLLFPLTAASGSTPSQAPLTVKTLAVSDLPAGYSKNTSSSSGSSYSNYSNPTGCFQKLGSFLSNGIIAKGIPSASVAYTNGQSELQERLISGKRANEQYTKFVRILNTCNSVSTTSQGFKLTGTLTPTSFQKVGDSSHAYKMTLTAGAILVDLYMVLFRAGQVYGQLNYSGNGGASAAQAFARSAVAKIQGKP